jgi:hypothetical protein
VFPLQLSITITSTIIIIIGQGYDIRVIHKPFEVLLADEHPFLKGSKPFNTFNIDILT